jgi:hypothetical protein
MSISLNHLNKGKKSIKNYKTDFYFKSKKNKNNTFKILLFLLFALVFLIHPTSAQNLLDQKKYSIETSLTFAPFAKIYMIKTSFRISEHNELGFGIAFQNWKNITKSPRGQAHAYTLLISYRYYIWKNLHVEVEFWPAYNHYNSFVDNKIYKGLELWVEYKMGYKFNFKNNLYLNLQPGLAHGIWMQNKWPEFQTYSTKEMIKNSLVFVPQVLFGVNF